MSAEDNLATVKGIYESFGKGDVPARHFRDGRVDHYRGTEDTAATVAMLGR